MEGNIHYNDVTNAFFIMLKVVQTFLGTKITFFLIKSCESLTLSVFCVEILSYFPPLFRLTTHSPSLQKASRSNPCPTFSNCTQNDVTSVLFCLTNFRKNTIVYYCCRLVWAYHAAKHRNGYCIFIISSKGYSPWESSTLWVYFFLRICYQNNCTFKSWKEFCWIGQCYETM